MVLGAGLVSCLNKADTKEIQKNKYDSIEAQPKQIAKQDSALRYIILSGGETGEGVAGWLYSNPKDDSYLKRLNPTKDMNNLKEGDTIIVGYPKDLRGTLAESKLDKKLNPQLK